MELGDDRISKAMRHTLSTGAFPDLSEEDVDIIFK